MARLTTAAMVDTSAFRQVELVIGAFFIAAAYCCASL
jgi:hypothetical protein